MFVEKIQKEKMTEKYKREGEKGGKRGPYLHIYSLLEKITMIFPIFEKTWNKVPWKCI